MSAANKPKAGAADIEAAAAVVEAPNVSGAGISAGAVNICIIPRVHGVGGMVSFRRKLEGELHRRGIGVVENVQNDDYAAILVIGGTRRLLGLSRARRRGVRVVQRLDGINWLHRLAPPWKAPSTGVRHYLRAEYGNLVLRVVRSRLATHVVYQSRFVLDWWQQRYGQIPADNTVIYNGVDLNQYTPNGPEKPPTDLQRVLVVEGSLMGGYEAGMETAVGLMERLALLSGENGSALALKVAGRVAPELRARCETRLRRSAPSVQLNWAGVVPPAEIPALDRSAHLLYSADINAACPNAAIEAMACGLPVVGFATGALPELVLGGGHLADYGGNPWKLDAPDLNGLAAAAQAVLDDNRSFRQAARARAAAEFSLGTMVDRYLDVLLGGAG